MTKIGARIGAILKADDKNVYLLGYGTYDGDDVPPSGFLHEAKCPNPKLSLDDGTVVWGYQCWWGEMSKVEDMIGDRHVIKSVVQPDNVNYTHEDDESCIEEEE